MSTLLDRIFLKHDNDDIIELNESQLLQLQYPEGKNGFRHRFDYKRAVYIVNRAKEISTNLKFNINHVSKGPSRAYLETTYHNTAFGRYYSDQTSFQNINKGVKEAIAVNYIDFDLKCAFQSVCILLAEYLNIQCDALKDYVNDRDMFLYVVINENKGLTKKEAKRWATSIMQGSKSIIKDRVIIPSMLFIKLVEEVEHIAKVVQHRFSYYAEDIDKKLNVDGKNHDMNGKWHDPKNRHLQILSNLEMIIENQLLMLPLELIRNSSRFSAFYSSISLEYDGFMIPSKIGKRILDQTNMVKSLKSLMMMNGCNSIEWALKPMEDGDKLLNKLGYKDSLELEKLIDISDDEKSFIEIMLERIGDTYRREYGTGVIYERKLDYYFECKYNDVHEFINIIFTDNERIIMTPRKSNEVIEFIKYMKHDTFPFIQLDYNYIGYKNGVYDLSTAKLLTVDAIPKNIQVRTMINSDCILDAPTPLFNSIIDYQFDEDEEKEHLLFGLGRALTRLDDHFDFMLMLSGESACGKSGIVTLIRHSYGSEQIGILSKSLENKFGLHILANKQLVICDDMPYDIAKMLDRGDYLCMMSRGPLSCPVKNGNPIEVTDWNIPTIINSNNMPNYKDMSGEIIRRTKIINFEKTVPESEQDLNLTQKIIDSEFGAVIHKCRSTYLKFKEQYSGQNVNMFTPERFLLSQDELRKDLNSSYEFSCFRLRYKENNKILKSEMTSMFREHVKKRFDLQRTREKLNPNDIVRSDSRFKFIRENICKHCRKKHLKDCCDLYNRKDRSKSEHFLNVELIDDYDI